MIKIKVNFPLPDMSSFSHTEKRQSLYSGTVNFVSSVRYRS